jgi:hypothetical protein
VSAGDTVHVTIRLLNGGPALEDVQMHNSLPPDLLYAGNLQASSGSASYAGGEVSWAGSVEPGYPVLITYEATVDTALTTTVFIANEADVEDGTGQSWRLSAAIVANGQAAYVPFMLRE